MNRYLSEACFSAGSSSLSLPMRSPGFSASSPFFSRKLKRLPTLNTPTILPFSITGTCEKPILRMRRITSSAESLGDAHRMRSAGVPKSTA